ncbi:hypothetical protein DL96DRAFT_1611138, partial [Flagelloscypha sp. PMI_526]
MRAWTISHRGQPHDVLHLNSNIPEPPPPLPNQLIIRVSFVALNPGSVVNMGMIPHLVRRFLGGPQSPVAEGEFSGIVHHAGEEARKRFPPGSKVFGTIPVLDVLRGNGCLTELISVPSSHVAVVPEGLDMAEAGGLSGSGQTALDMFSAIKVAKGDRIFVNGSTGGVGIMVVQIAKAKGAYVIASCSAGNASFVQRLGADEVVDYRQRSLVETLTSKFGHEPFDFILDTVGTQSLFLNSPSYLKPSGQYINVGNFEGVGLTIWRSFLNSWTPLVLGGVPRVYQFIAVDPKGEKAEVLGEMAKNRQLRVVVEEVFSFENVLQGYTRVTSRRARGKVVIQV